MELTPPKIYFISSDAENPGIEPELAAKSLPDWYRTYKRYDENKNSTWRNCVPFFDAMTSGYVLSLPCDITFKYDGSRLTYKVANPIFENFIEYREELPGFHAPFGYYKQHFAWLPRWAVSLEEGFSALYTTPFNMFNLPFIGAAGIIDNDKINTPGRMPFFMKEGWEGTLEEGTPFVQIIPFRRENWELHNVQADALQVSRNMKRSVRFRSVKSDFYRDHSWSRKKYKISDELHVIDESEDTKND